MTGAPLPSAREPDVPVVVRRSARRCRSVQAYWRDGQVVVLVPASLTAAQEQRYVRELVERVTRRRSVSAGIGEEQLQVRAAELSRRYLDGTAVPSSVRWVTNQQRRWGSCTLSTGAIRLSHRLRPMPRLVIDYVLVHELAHLLQAGHGTAFRALLARYPHTDRAEGYLDGVAAGAGQGWLIDDPDDPDDPVVGHPPDHAPAS